MREKVVEFQEVLRFNAVKKMADIDKMFHFVVQFEDCLKRPSSKIFIRLG